MEKSEFLARLSTLEDAFSHTLSDPLAGIWWDACQDYPDNLLDKAFSLAQRQWESKFDMVLAKFLKLIEGDPREKAVLAWALVDKNRNNRKGQYTYDDPAIQIAVDACGGLPVMGLMDEICPALEKKFKEAYFAACNQIKTKALPFDNPCQMIAQCSRAPEGEPHGN